MIFHSLSANWLIFCQRGGPRIFVKYSPVSFVGQQDNVLQFNPEDGSWTQVGQLQGARFYHGASVVNVDDIIDYCY